MAFSGEMKREHNIAVSESAEGQRHARYRKALHRDRVRYAETYWAFRERGQLLPKLIAGCSPECIEAARLSVESRNAEPVEVLTITITN